MIAPRRPLPRGPLSSVETAGLDYARPLFWGVAGALVVAWAALLTWPMRIWDRPVSPHTHLVGTFGVGFEGALRYTATVLVLFALYGVALWLVLTRRVRPHPLLVLGGTALWLLLLLPTHPLTSTDIFNYIASARVYWVHGDNPLTVPPLARADDPFFALLTNWQNIPSPYGPLWSLIAGVPVWLGNGDALWTVLAFKATTAAFFLASVGAVYLTAQRIRPDSAVPAALALGWNPLAVFHVAGNGHNDVVMTAFLALSLYFLARKQVAAAIVLLAASALTKYATVLVAPVVVVWLLSSRRRPSLRSLVLGGGGAVLLALLAFAPFWSGPDTVATALEEGTYYTVSVPAVVRGTLERIIDDGDATAITLLVTRVGFLAVYVLLLLRLPRRGRLDLLVEVGFLALFAYISVAATYFAPWYVLWPLTLACMLPYRRDVLWPAVTLTLTAMAVLVAAVWFRERFAPDPRVDWLGTHLFAVIAVFPLPLLVWWWAVRYPPGAPVRRAALVRARRAGVDTRRRHGRI